MLNNPKSRALTLTPHFPSVHPWVTLQLTNRLYFSVVFIICIAIGHRSSSLRPGQGNSDAAQTQGKRLIPALKSLQARKLRLLLTRDFSTQLKAWNGTSPQQTKTYIFKPVKKNLQIFEQRPNSKFPECFKSALYVIPQVVKLLPLLCLSAELLINTQMKRREVKPPFYFTGFSLCRSCLVQNNQIPYFFRE